MADFLETVLSDAEPEVPAEAAPVQEAPVVEPVAQPEAVEAPAPEPDAKQEEARHVPLPTFLDMRDRAKDLERQLEEARRTQQQAQPQAIPDPIDDPDGFNAYYGNQLGQALAAQKFQMSDVMARQTHTDEVVEAAVDWAAARAAKDPTFAASYMSEAHPIDWIVRQHKRDAIVSQIGDVPSLDDWFAQEAAKRGYQPQSAPVAAAPQFAAVPLAPKPAAPPRSIASDTSIASAPVTSDNKAEFEAIFNGR